MEEGLLRELTAALSPTPAVGARQLSCSPAVDLPANGILVLPGGDTVTLTSGALFKPACTPAGSPAIIANGGGVSNDESSNANDGSATSSLTTSDFRDPFYASTFPQCYALAATTVVAYTLVVMLLITPRSFLDGGVVVLGRRRFTDGGASGKDIGGRPWLQKVAALTVAISLTIASINTFNLAEYQYSIGVQDAKSLQTQVMDTTELEAIRIISDTFLWLAQAQTLIRLFPRQREKVIIKWTAFALVTLDVIFQSLDSFKYSTAGGSKPQNFTEAVPALSYLFQLSLGVLYAAWVIYYSLLKKRYAFYHPKMKNICLVAILSLLAILVPVVFFVLDISQPDFTGWGDYVRWVGAAAASVIVWEWVERIEALEREEKKDGILGREVFDGDEMLEIIAPDINWPRRRKNRKPKEGDGGESGEDPQGGLVVGRRTNIWPSMSSIATRYRSRSQPRDRDQPSQPSNTESTNNERTGDSRPSAPPLWLARPVPAATPVSRTDTASAVSTLYAVRYQQLAEAPRTTPSPLPPQEQEPTSRSNSITSSHHSTPRSPSVPGPSSATSQNSGIPEREPSVPGQRWRSLAQANPLRRFGRNLPDDSRSAPVQEDRIQHDEAGRWDIRARLEEFAVTQAEKLRERIRPTPDTENLPITVIPAPQRRGHALAQLREEDEAGSEESTPSQANGTSSPPSSTEQARPALWRSNSVVSVSSGPAPPDPARTARTGPPVQRDGDVRGGGPSQSALGKQRADSIRQDGPSRLS